MYKLQPNSLVTGEPSKIVQRLSDGAFIPFDPANTDYIAYLKWVAEGNQAEPADA
jgi:hypothetical protein